MAISKDELNDLRKKALEIKKQIVELAEHAQEGHCASALSIADIIAALYFHRLRIDPLNPGWEERDRFILSKGHACQALYVALHQAGFFDKEKLYTFLQPDTGLAGHPILGGAPGIEASTGSLGQGFSLSVGMALAAKVDGRGNHVFVIIGDGESNEGIVWEAALAASHYKLDNLTAVLDRNNYQCDGFSQNVLNIDPIEEKWRSFGWQVQPCDGHNLEALVGALDQVPFASGKPSLILARTVKGKGVSYMESNAAWHYRAPTQEELDLAVADLEASCQL
jgi:transketolase